MNTNENGHASDEEGTERYRRVAENDDSVSHAVIIIPVKQFLDGNLFRVPSPLLFLSHLGKVGIKVLRIARAHQQEHLPVGSHVINDCATDLRAH